MLGWAGNVLIVIGIWMIGDKRRHAFLFSIAGELLYTWRSVLLKDWPLAFICALFCVMAFRNWLKWGSRKEPNPNDIVQVISSLYLRAHGDRYLGEEEFAAADRLLRACKED